jgi:UDP-N-acetylmuramoyl-L-alanyl-D-glutamate--2,6-diaminopimelate ligase
MKLYELIGDLTIEEVTGDTIIDIKAISIDSKKVKKGDLFICIDGTRTDGHKYIPQAIARGAAAIVVTKPIEACSVPVVRLNNSRRAYSLLSAKFHGYPARSLELVSVTGTNGKTTTTYILKTIFERAGFKCGVIGTNGVVCSEFTESISLTTPAPFELNYILRKMVSAGVKYVFFEASAHAIFLDKLLGIQARAGILTNITQDHLDFFVTMERYSRTKLSYFKPGFMKLAVLNADDPYSRTIMENRQVPYLTYGINNPSDVFVIDYETTSSGSRYILNLFDEIYEIDTPLYGVHNVYNALAAATVAKALGVDGEIIAEALSQMSPVDGRFNVIENNGRRIIIDYAHTPDGLSNLISAARKITTGKLITVFGCGGDRDKGKRPIMGELAGKNSEYVIITSDNPRSEAPEDIIKEIEEGIKHTACEYTSIVERPEAIAYALKLASDGDTVLIAGKGAENYLEIKGVKLPYSDKEAVANNI